MLHGVSVSRDDVPRYGELIYPTIVAVAALGGSAQGAEITTQVSSSLGLDDDLLALMYDNRPKSILVDRLEWARSYAKLGGALDSPRRGLFALTVLGKEIIALPEGQGRERARELDREVRARRRGSGQGGSKQETGPDETPPEVLESEGDVSWREHLLRRLHALTPTGFEDFVMYLLRTFGLELKRVGGSGDEGIDGIGLAPISPVLSSRVAVQAKRYDPATAIGREVVALFQRDAGAAGAERAVLVTLGRFSEAARKAATVATPTVDLIDGEKLCDLVRQQEIGIEIVPRVIEEWFNRFDA